MSGKYTKTKARKKKKHGLLFVIAAVVLLAAAVLLLTTKDNKKPEAAETASSADVMQETQIAEAVQENVRPTTPRRKTLRNNLEVLDIGAYTGVYMEDGTDEILSNILMLKLINNGQDTVEYAKITMELSGETAEFTVSTLKPGETIILLEKNRMSYDKTVDYGAMDIACENLALFQEPLSLHEDKLTIQCLNGAINVTNISGQDITGKIAIYYKNKAAGILYGGITYRIVLENGLKAGEVSQMMASHFSETGSEIVFVTITQ